MTTFSAAYLDEVRQIVASVDADAIERGVEVLARSRADGGRLFILGVGGSAGNASHAVNDFRKLAGFEAYAPTDNVSELTARTNDEGWSTVFEAWLRTSRLKPHDAILVLSVGGGDAERNVSANLVAALDYAKSVGAPIVAIVGRDGGHAGRVADVTVLVPSVNASHITPHSEEFQGIAWHLMVSHPGLKAAATKWESFR
jgi:D-sedoheptulose 7-phosphate isomerase